MLNRRKALQTLAAATAAASFHTRAATWPDRPIKLIIPFPAGGPSDVHARYVATGINTLLGQPVVSENVAGAGGSIGMGQVARSPADGYTIGLGHTGTHCVNPFLQAHLSYDPLRSFTPVARLTEYTSVLFVNPQRPYKTLADLLAAAKAQPGRLTYGSAGIGSTNHLATEMLARAAGVQFTHVPYKGYAPARTDLLAGTIDFMFDVWGTAGAEYIKSGRLRALASSARTRLDSMPDIPAAAETVRGYSASGWTGIFAPARTPAAVVDVLESAIRKTLEAPGAQAAFRTFGYEAAFAGGKQLASIVAKDHAEMAALIKAIGLKPE